MRKYPVMPLIFSVIIVIVDAFILNQGVISTILLFTVLVFMLPKTIYMHYRKKEYKTSYIKCLIYVTAALLVFFSNYVNNKIAHNRSEVLIAKIEQFKKQYSKYPENLQALVPDILPSIPSPKYILSFNKFHYHQNEGNASLYYVVLPPYGRKGYDFNEKEWSVYD